MNCSVTELRNKEVINTKNGCRLGCVSDVEICCDNGSLTAIIIWRRTGLGIFGNNTEDIRIPWCDIQVIGDDTILVCSDNCCCDTHCRERRKFADFLFNK